MPPSGPPDSKRKAKKRARANANSSAKLLYRRSNRRSELADIERVVDYDGGGEDNGSDRASDHGGGPLADRPNGAARGQEAVGNAIFDMEAGLAALVDYVRGPAIDQENVRPGRKTHGVKRFVPDDAISVAARAITFADDDADGVGDDAIILVSDDEAGADAGADVEADTGARANADEDAQAKDITFVPDHQLKDTKLWGIVILSPVNSKSSAVTKKKWDDAFVHLSLFDDSLNCRFTVDKEWATMPVHRIINRSGLKIHRRDFVLVRPDRGHPKGGIKRPAANEKERILTPRNDWVAQILEFRARDASQVYALVAWLYWPEDLYTAWPEGGTKALSGKKGYHGDYELVASNHLDIIDIYTIDDVVEKLVERDLEDHDGDGCLTECYYRQYYDYKTGKLSELKRYCICKKYNKPEQQLVQCTNVATCGIWMHEASIIHKVLSTKYAELCRINTALKNNRKELKAVVAPPNDINSVFINDRKYSKHLRGKLVADENKVEVTEIGIGLTTNVRIQCLKCNTLFT